MDVMGARRSIQPGELASSDAQRPQQPTAATVEPMPVHPAPVAQKVLGQSAMLRTMARFLTAQELVAFARTARTHGQAVAAELGHRSACLDTQYAELFDQYGSLNAQFAALRPAGGSAADQLRALRGKVKALQVEMDAKLQAWDEIQHAWANAGIAQPRPVLTRDECYLG